MIAFIKNILCSNFDGITINQGRVLETIDVTERQLTPEQKETKNTITKTDISKEDILENLLSNKKHYLFFAIVFSICFIFNLTFTLLGVFVHFIFGLFAIFGILISLVLLTSVILHIHDKIVFNKEIKNNNVLIVQLCVKQKLVEKKDNSENEYTENYVVLENDDKIIFNKYFDLIQKGDTVYAVYTANKAKLLKIYPEFKYNIL